MGGSISTARGGITEAGVLIVGMYHFLGLASPPTLLGLYTFLISRASWIAKANC
jgi:hypothetical protein